MNTSTSLGLVRPEGCGHYLSLPIFGSIVERFTHWSLDKGYAINSLRVYLGALQGLIPWFRRRHIRSYSELTADHIEEAHRYHRLHRQFHLADGINAFGLFLKADQNLKPKPVRALTRSEQLVAIVIKHLREERGLAESTWRRHGHHLRLLLRFLRVNRRRAAVYDISLGAVNQFLQEMSRTRNRETMKQVVATVRMFLRFEFMRGTLRVPLHDQIDSIRVYRGERLPQALEWSKVQTLLRRIDRSTPLGLRDFAILLLAATYGLRRSDVAALALEDIDWRQGTLRIRQQKTRQTVWLPLTHEVGTALVKYLRHGRPTSDCHHVFLCGNGPRRPLGPPAVYRTLGRASRDTGVPLPSCRFHGLRHAVALRLLRHGVPLKSISDVLGHRDPNSSIEYLRLHIDDLRKVALPVPTNRTSPLRTHSSGKTFSEGPRQSSRRAWGTVTERFAKAWHSFLSPAIQDYQRWRSAFGRDPRATEWTLRTLDFYLARKHVSGRFFTEEMFIGWTRTFGGLSPGSARIQMLCVRNFCLRLARTDPRTFIPEIETFPRSSPPKAPYLFPSSEVARLLKVAKKIKRFPSNPLRPDTIRLAIVLLFCCGLRHNELLHLKIGDIDTDRGVLRIDRTKFNKTRLIPVSPSVAMELGQYLRKRRKMGLPSEPNAPLIWSHRTAQSGAPLCQAGFRAIWLQICRAAGSAAAHGHPPRVQDARHSFAVESLRRSYRGGDGPQAALPRLSRYLGHASVVGTHYYLKFTEQLRRTASDRFRRNLISSLFSSADSGTKKGGVK